MNPCVHLARLSLEHFLRFKRPLQEVPPDIAEALGPRRAATFVSIHTLTGELRGCIGTLTPCCPTLGEEILENAISAGTRDYRFHPVTHGEMANLAISVDVLSETEAIASREELDPKRYGLIVSDEEGHRGVLLPDLEGVDTVEEQIRIACRKAGIHPKEGNYNLQRFTVERHRE